MSINYTRNKYRIKNKRNSSKNNLNKKKVNS